MPYAVAVDQTGDPVCAPAEGIGAVKALVDGIVIRNDRNTEDLHAR